MNELQIATTEDFLALMADSRYENRNRGPVDELAEELDPDGKHLLVFKFVHKRWGFNPETSERTASIEEWRCQWFVKLKDKLTPVPIMMDNGFEALEAHTRILKYQEPTWDLQKEGAE
jgi:hypothetical protein